MYPTDKKEMTTLLSRSKVRNEDVGFFMFSFLLKLKLPQKQITVSVAV